jgi:hypothetical protein
LAVVDEPVELCVTRLRYAQIHGFSRLVVEVSDLADAEPSGHSIPPSRGKNLLSLRKRQAILMTRSDRPSGCRWPAIRRVALHPTEAALAGRHGGLAFNPMF